MPSLRELLSDVIGGNRLSVDDYLDMPFMVYTAEGEQEIRSVYETEDGELVFDVQDYSDEEG